MALRPSRHRARCPQAGSHFRSSLSVHQQVEKAPRAFLNGFQGRLQCDGYGVYPSIAAEQPGWRLYYCVAHWRRKFIDAKDEDRRANWLLLQLRHLYAIENRLRTKKASAKVRHLTREQEARPIWERMRRYLERIEGKVLPASRLGKALA